jgi:hypothetical protein
MSKLSQVESNERSTNHQSKKGSQKKGVSLQNEWPYVHNYSDSKMNLSYAHDLVTLRLT